MIDEDSRRFLEELLTTPSPSGYEEEVQAVVRRWAEPFADEVSTDVHGNVVAARNREGSPRILLDGHCDQIGLMVQHIDEGGFLWVQPIGGWDPPVLLGQEVVVLAAGESLPGVIARKPKHLLTEEEGKQMPKVTDLWVDIGAASREEAQKRVDIGDPVTLKPRLQDLPNRRVSGPKMDNTAGLFVVFEALRRLEGTSFAGALFVVSAVQEEIGLRGARTAAYGVDPMVGIAVDVTHATDCPTIERKEHGEVDLGKGPVLFRGPNINPVVFRRLRRLAREEELPLQLKGAPRGTPNDTNVIQLTRAGVATAALGIPNRYMHSPVEMISLADLDAAAELVARFVATTEAEAVFIPGAED